VNATKATSLKKVSTKYPNIYVIVLFLNLGKLNVLSLLEKNSYSSYSAKYLEMNA